MKNNNNNSVNEIEQLASTIIKGSKNTLSDILSEAVSKYLKEDILEDEDETEDKDNEETTDENTSEVEETDTTSDDTENVEEDTKEADDVEETDVTEDTESEVDEWSDFDDYKISNDEGSEEYDFTNETDTGQLVKVFKLMKNDDQVSVVKDGDKVTIKDNETDAEYVIELDCEESCNNNEFNNEITMSESLGYTDNYQDVDPIEGLSMEEPAKNKKDWHKGVPTGTQKPWAGKGNSKPFGEKAEKVFEITLNDNVDFEDEDEMPMEEATNVGGFVQQNSTSKSHVPNSNGRNARNASKGGAKIKSTSEPRYKGMDESLQRKINAALLENKQLKETVAKVSKIMKEAVQVNVNLGHIVRLMVENSTTKTEKEDIVRRFNNVKSNDEAKNLYESISSELKKSHASIVTEQATTVENSKKINEAKIYEEPNGVLDMMKRMNMIK